MFEFIWGESYDNKYNDARIFNCLSGICLIITMPIPFENSLTKDCYYFDTQSRYTDYIIHFGGGGSSSHDHGIIKNWVLQVAWITLYTSWDWEFVTRYFGYGSFVAQTAHLFPPMMRCYFYYRSNVNNNHNHNNSNNDHDGQLQLQIAIGGIYFQSRTNALMMYGMLIQPIRDFVIGSRFSTNVFPAYGMPLMIWSIVNFFLTLIYVYWWFLIKRRELKRNLMVRQQIDQIDFGNTKSKGMIKSIQISGL